jgi:uncharacterized lipoprotein YmbA
MNTIYTRLFPILLLAGLVGGCAKGPPPEFFVLNPTSPSVVPGFEQGITIGIGPVSLPKHLDRNQIVSRVDSTKLLLSEQNQWAEPLKEGVTRTLLVSVSLALDSNRIYALPLRQRRAMDYQVAVDVMRLDGRLGQGTTLVARWLLLSGDAKKILSTKVSRIEETAGGATMNDLVHAQSRAVEALGKEIAAHIKDKSS